MAVFECGRVPGDEELCALCKCADEPLAWCGPARICVGNLRDVRVNGVCGAVFTALGTAGEGDDVGTGADGWELRGAARGDGDVVELMD